MQQPSLDSKNKLNCVNCGNFLAFYNPITKLYKPLIIKKYQQGKMYFELPVKFSCKKDKKEYTIEKEQFALGKEIKCEICGEVLAKFSHSQDGIAINLTHASDIECANCIMECLDKKGKCTEPYNLEKLRTTNKSIGIVFKNGKTMNFK